MTTRRKDTTQENVARREPGHATFLPSAAGRVVTGRGAGHGFGQARAQLLSVPSAMLVESRA